MRSTRRYPLAKKRHKNLPGTPERHMGLADFRHLMRENKAILQTLPDVDVHWAKGHDLKKQLDTLGKTDYITWIGHATFLMQLSGKTILIDPFFSSIAGPFGKFGPKRYVPPALDIHELPPIDYILITHNHYDHLDMPFLKKLKPKAHTTIIAPTDLGKLIKKSGFKHIIELGWYETYKTENITFTALPAYHYSKRGLFDRNLSHWCGFAITSEKYKLFHSGDTAYGPIFKEIGEKYGPFDFAMLAIGAYMPVEIMKLVHTNPAEALQIGIDLKARCILPMHWGTIVLTSEPIDEPLKKLYKEREISHALIDIELNNIGDLLVL